MIAAFDDIIADVEANKKLSPIITELFLGGRKLSIALVFISQFYFKVHILSWNYLRKENFSK